MTWTLLALGSALALPRRRAARGRRGRGGVAERPSPRAGRRGAHRAVSGQPLRAAGRARGGRARGGRRRARLGDHAHLSELRLLLPPGLGPRAARRRSRRRSRPTPRRPSTRSTSRSARVLGAGLRRVRRPRARARLPALARRAGVRHLPARRGGLRALERRAGARCSWPPARRSCSTRRAATSTRRSSRWWCGRACSRPRAAAAAALALLVARRPAAARRRGCWAGACGGSRTAASARALALALAAAPVIWALTDLAVTGDPLHSLHATSELADDLGRERGLEHVPGSFVSFVGDTVRPPVALLAPVGAGARRARARLARAARAAGAVRRRRDHVRRHRRCSGSRSCRAT